MACYIFGAGSFYGLNRRPQPEDYVIAADGGWRACCQAEVTPNLLLGDFDSLEQIPVFDNIHRVPVEKDDTDMMLAVKQGLAKGETEFHLYGGMGGSRTDHTIANLQTLAYLARRGAVGWLYGNGEQYTAICNGSMTFPARARGILSVFCLGTDAEGVAIEGGQYTLQDAVLTAEFPLGVSNHFVGQAITVSVRSGLLLLGLHEE
ncbi:MAG: thiamine diphosphokinase [Clostridiales bacterium]|nr:thiamine diphosphokinase [Candidatus Cacconaster stercorequi]